MKQYIGNNLVKTTTADGVEVLANYPLLPEAAPMADREAASKKYVDDKVVITEANIDTTEAGTVRCMARVAVDETTKEILGYYMGTLSLDISEDGKLKLTLVEDEELFGDEEMGGGEFPGCENLAEEYLIVAGTYIETRDHDPIDPDGSCDGDIDSVTRVELLEDCVVTRNEELECYWAGLGSTRTTYNGGVPDDFDTFWNLFLDGETWSVKTMTSQSITKPKGVGPAGQYAADECLGMYTSVFGAGEVTEVAP
jgi:hypothetical protein